MSAATANMSANLTEQLRDEFRGMVSQASFLSPRSMLPRAGRWPPSVLESISVCTLRAP